MDKILSYYSPSLLFAAECIVIFSYIINVYENRFYYKAALDKKKAALV